jgi:chemotaxis protein MotB
LLVRVEGHTDSQPISTSRFPSNWELSAARATTVLRHFVKRSIPASRMSVAGYAGERPIADNTTLDGRALNRRVDIVVLRSEK